MKSGGISPIPSRCDCAYCAERRGRQSLALTESAGEVGCAVEAALLGYLLHGGTGSQQQTLGLAQTVAEQVFMRRTVDVTVEAADEVGFAHTADFRERTE